MNRQIQDDALYNDEKEKKTKRRTAPVLACFIIYGILSLISILYLVIKCNDIKEHIIIKDGYNNIITEEDGVYLYQCKDMVCSDIWNNAIVPVPCGYLESYGIR